ncbi:MAG: hypothetical protein P4M09_16800 [Devosia sp.]|nr:hypothetical protein [Devosia sp.]
MSIRGSLLTEGLSGDATGVVTRIKPKRAEISAVITRADGRIEDLGTISYWHRNPLRRWAWNIGHWFKERTAR